MNERSESNGGGLTCFEKENEQESSGAGDRRRTEFGAALSHLCLS